MRSKILCVAEKNSVAKAVAGHLSGGSFHTRNSGNQYIKNYDFSFDFGPPWGNCEVTMTAVSGHMTNCHFGPEYKSWSYPPPERLFDAPVFEGIDDDKKTVAQNIESQARHAKALFIWTDCDREGEHIGGEVRDAALKGNNRLDVKRAKFSNIERAHVLQAARSPVQLDQRQIDAVAARIELDLRIGFAFTRLQTNQLRSVGGPLTEAMLSYGSCQFPTLGFVVDRYFKVKNFVPEPFWSIVVSHKREGISVNFRWARVHLFDRAAVTILFERCLLAKKAKVTKIQEKPTKKWKPLPLTTVELQKMASRFLNMTGQEAMTAAESLYQKGFISYPRTETDRFDKGIDLKRLIEKQCPNNAWGQYAQGLLNGAFQQPRNGRNDDKAHPPIHPVTHAQGSAFANEREKRIYEFVVRRFLACCSDDAKGQSTDVGIEYGEETFRAHGLIVLEQNYLLVYPYEKWTSSTMLPKFTLGETFEPTEAMMNEGKTSPPSYLTEPDLIALMDANGIGTDATMAEHIAKVKERLYVMTRLRGASNAISDTDAEIATAGNTRGGRGGRGSRGGRASRGGRGGSARGGGRQVEEFLPTTLGVALIKGYDEIGLESSLGKPFLRKEMEASMKQICEGRKSREAVLQESLQQYRQAFLRTQSNIRILKDACRRYVLNNDTAG